MDTDATMAYTTRQQHAARWYEPQHTYGSTTQANTNAQRALHASGYNADAWQVRQIISWRQLTSGNANSLRAQKTRHAKGTLRTIQPEALPCRMAAQCHGAMGDTTVETAGVPGPGRDPAMLTVMTCLSCAMTDTAQRLTVECC
jgi:hypothetical protein